MKPLKVLLIEDSPSDVRLVREALKDICVPVELTVAHDGVDAMDHLHLAEAGQTRRPDLVLLDLNLPRKSGREVLSEVKTSPLLKMIPVLVMTSSRSEEDINQSYMLNANGYITKPASLSEYTDIIRAIEQFWFFTVTLPEPPIRRAAPSVAGLQTGAASRTVH